MNVNMVRVIILTLCFLCTATVLLAADEDGHDWHPHHVSLFAGYSSDLQGRIGFKLGLEYVYRTGEWFSLRGAADFTGKDFGELSLSAGGDIWPIRGVPFYIGAGFGAKHVGDQWKPFMRLLAGEDFHVGVVTLSPLLMYDIYYKKNYLTFGVGIGYGF